MIQLVKIDPFAVETLLEGFDQTWGTREVFYRGDNLRFKMELEIAL